MTSSSTGELRGSAATPKADLACRPASPKTSTINLLAASITFGCSKNSGVLATKPESFTILATRSIEPRASTKHASAWIAQMRAAS